MKTSLFEVLRRVVSKKLNDVSEMLTTSITRTMSKFIEKNKTLTFRAVFRDILPCKIIVDRRFRGAYCLHHQGYSPPWELEISHKTLTFPRCLLHQSPGRWVSLLKKKPWPDQWGRRWGSHEESDIKEASVGRPKPSMPVGGGGIRTWSLKVIGLFRATVGPTGRYRKLVKDK
jgi:hypothetical protein